MQSIAWQYFDDTKMITFLKGMAKLIHPINKISKFKINPNQSFDLIVQESPDDPMRTLNSAYGGSRISRRSESFSAPWHLSELANDFYDKFNTQMTGGLLTIVTALKIFRTSRTIQGTVVDQRLSYQTLSYFSNFHAQVSILFLEATAACEDENIGMATETMMDIVQWLLAKNIIQQQHTFVYFMCPDFSREAIVTSQNLDTLPGSHDNNRNEFNY